LKTFEITHDCLNIYLDQIFDCNFPYHFFKLSRIRAIQVQRTQEI
jgi:hypothetical protein